MSKRIVALVIMAITVSAAKAELVDITAGPVDLWLKESNPLHDSTRYSRFCSNPVCDDTATDIPISATLAAKEGMPVDITIVNDQNASPTSWLYDSSDYNGHTFYIHGLDLPSANSGFILDKGSNNNAAYSIPDIGHHTGSYLYNCHVHQVKHKEMGEIGALIIRPVDQNNDYINAINNDGGITKYDYELLFVLQTIDSNYHGSGNNNPGPIGDDAAFAHYVPDEFLASGSTAEIGIITAPAGTVFAIRIFGAQSVNAIFGISEGFPANKQDSFDVYNKDGRILPEKETRTFLTVAPGETYDILFTKPNTTDTVYPEVYFHDLSSQHLEYANSNRWYSLLRQ